MYIHDPQVYFLSIDLKQGLLSFGNLLLALLLHRTSPQPSV